MHRRPPRTTGDNGGQRGTTAGDRIRRANVDQAPRGTTRDKGGKRVDAVGRRIRTTKNDKGPQGTKRDKSGKQKEDDENNEMTDCLIVLDDCLGYLRTSAIEKLCAKFRHYKISMFIAVQNFRMLPVTCRYNAQYWCIWHLNSKKELANIEDEMDQSFPDFLKYYKEGTSKRYSFIYCDMKKQVIRENFGKILYDKDGSYGKEKSPQRTPL